VIAIFETLRTFCVIIAMLLVIRNLSWCGTLIDNFMKAGPSGVRSEWNEPRTFPQGVVRLGTALLSLMTLTAFLLPTVNRHVDWLRAGDHPALATLSLAMLSVLLVWRWLNFARQYKQAILAMVAIFCVAIAAQFGAGVGL
jgi:hypothetical protein